MINTTDEWATTPMQILNHNNNGIVFMKGDVITILTNVGSPVGRLTLERLREPVANELFTYCAVLGSRQTSPSRLRPTSAIACPPPSECPYQPSSHSRAEFPDRFASPPRTFAAS